MKIGLGTAQFGLNYGIANGTGQIDSKLSKEIVNFARDIGINIIDTALAYGNSHKVLAKSNLSEFQVVSKLPSFQYQYNSSAYVEDNFYKSLEELQLESIYSFMFHSSADLFSEYGKDLYDSMKKLKDKKLIEKIGVSIYNPNDLGFILENFEIDIVQVPLNVFDQRLISSGYLNKLKMLNIEIHIRSIFLQGLLLLHKDDIPNRFTPWNEHFQKWHSFNSDNNCSPLESSIAFVKNQILVDKIIVGIDSLNQLREICSAYSSTKQIEFNRNLSVDDLDLIDPSRWHL